MRTLQCVLSWLISLSLAAASPLGAACDSPERSWQPIPFGAQAVPMITVPAELRGAVVVTPPLHGQLTRDTDGGLYYTPEARFWTVGTDRFTLLSSGFPGGAHTVQLLAPTQRLVEYLEGAEQPPSSSSLWQVEGPRGGASFEPWAALAGERGFWVVPSVLGDSYLKAPLPGLGHGYGDAGTGAQGGWKPPGSGGGAGGACIPPECPWPEADGLILTLGSPDEHYVGLRARTGDAGVELRLEASGSTPGRWLRVALASHQLTLLAWDRDNAPSLAAVFLDGELVATTTLGFRMMHIPTAEARFGSQDADLNMPEHGWDQLAVFALKENSPRANCLRQDRFDGETLSNQWHTYGPSHLRVESSGVFESGVLTVDPAGAGNPAGGLVIATGLIPQAIGRLGVRFALDAESLTVPEGSTVLLADAANNQLCRSFRVLLEGTAAGPRLRVIATHLDNQSMPAATASLLLASSGRSILEIDWQRSTTDRVGTGYLRLFVNGEEKAELIGLHNHNQKLMDVRVGGITVAGNPSGKVALNDLELWYEP